MPILVNYLWLIGGFISFMTSMAFRLSFTFHFRQAGSIVWYFLLTAVITLNHHQGQRPSSKLLRLLQS
jgi:hypothetical protein